jgi:hypothetical protein
MNISLSYLNLEGVHIPKASLRGAVLYGTTLRNANLSEVNFTGAVMNFADISGSDVSDAEFGKFARFTNIHSDAIVTALFGPANDKVKIVVSAARDASIVVWDYENQKIFRKIVLPENINITHLLLLDAQKAGALYAIAVGEDRVLCAWDMATGH